MRRPQGVYAGVSLALSIAPGHHLLAEVDNATDGFMLDVGLKPNKGPCVSFLGFSTTGPVCRFLADENLEGKDDVTNMSGEHSRHRLEIKF